jgi:hypothetical protein
MLVVALKDPTPENRAAFEKIGNEFGKATGGKFTYGWTVEDNNKAMVLSAWDSLEVSFRYKILSDYLNPMYIYLKTHMDLLQLPEVAVAFEGFLSLADTHGKLFHVDLVTV